MCTEKTLKNRIELFQSLRPMIGNKIFTVTFTKKDGTERVMNCRLGVQAHLSGGKSTINHKENLVSVYDMQAKGYRCFNLESVKTLTFSKNVITFK